MIRTGHSRAGRALRDHRITALVAVAMLLLTLCASLLVSAGSPHHDRGPHASVHVAAPTGDVLTVRPAWHEHRHGHEVAPTLGKRPRPAATAAFVGIVPFRLTGTYVPVVRAAVASPAHSDGQASPGVLRV